MHHNRVKLVEYMFDQAAERYAIDIAPVFWPLVADFVAYAAPRREDRVLDLGAGIGLLARTIAPYVRYVVGLDISRESLRVGRETPAPLNVHYAQADIHRLPVAYGSVSLVVAHFGLNATFPDASLRAVRKLIAPGGRLVIQEWGPASDADRVIGETLQEYSEPDPGEHVQALRAGVDASPADWGDYLQDVDDYREWLADLGLTIEDAREEQPVAIRLADVEDYLRYKLAWTYRWEEVRAMQAQTRVAFYAAVRERLQALVEPDGSFIWRPWVIRVSARAG